MKIAADIRQLYKPVQPTVYHAAEDVTYFEFLPDARLENFIYCYWQLKTTKPLSEQFNYRVVADGCIDIFFELTHPQNNFVMGFCEQYMEFPLTNSFNYIGVRFLPTMFPQIFRINASELSNRFEQLRLINPDTAQFISARFNYHHTIDEIKCLFDNYFMKLIGQKTFDEDNRIYEAIQIILKNFGVVDTETDLNTGISPRQLRRLFEFYIGDTPKTFSKVIRFQNILSARPSSQMLRQNKLFLEAGYYDQAHFIKEFKHLYGVSPGKAFRR